MKVETTTADNLPGSDAGRAVNAQIAAGKDNEMKKALRPLLPYSTV
jgi:hypothetical protein